MPAKLTSRISTATAADAYDGQRVAAVAGLEGNNRTTLQAYADTMSGDGHDTTLAPALLPPSL